MTRLILCGCIFGLLLAVAGQAQEKDDAKRKDEKLIASIKAALKQEIEADKVEAAVGRAALNTVREQDRDTFSLADIATDSDSGPALPDRETIRYVVYWVRPGESRNPKIVGIVWPNKGKPQVFFGEVLPRG
jgi:hypothetical protein